MRVERFKERMRKMREYYGIAEAAEQVIEQRITLNNILIKKEKELKETKQLNLLEQYRAQNRICVETNQELNQFKKDILTIVIELSKQKKYGIGHKEFESLKEKIESYYTKPLEQSLFSSAEDLQLQLARLKNQYFQKSTIVTSYLCSKIGGGSVQFAPSQIFSSAESYVTEIGEAFNAEIFIVDRPVVKSIVISATVDGVEYPVKDGILKFTEKPTVKGRHKYTVRYKTKNRFTGKTDVFRRTFSYLAQ